MGMRSLSIKRLFRYRIVELFRPAKEFFVYIGGVSVLCGRTIVFMTTKNIRPKHVLAQMNGIGVSSFPIVLLISLFTGIVLALQSAYQMQQFSAEMYIAPLVALSLTRELGPVLTALIVAGRCGASITAELGTMKVTEQVDALETLSTDPVSYLVVPRFVAMVIMVPLLTVYANVAGILGGYLTGVSRLGISHSLYIQMTVEALTVKDLTTGLIKSLSFAVLICLISCFQGLNSAGGAQGVGRATTGSVVKSFILIIVADLFFTALFYFVF